MRPSIILLGAIAAVAQASGDLLPRKDGNSGSGSSSSGSGSGGGKCPPVWTAVSADLGNAFRAGSGGECNDVARAAIRMIFHDCGTWDTSQGLSGGCDGSLANTDEVKRPENGGLADITALCRAKAVQYSVPVADMLVFMGNKAILMCPGGPRVKTYIGRTDSFVEAKEGGLPDVHAPAANLFGLFAAKGYNAEDLAALLGAHSTSRQFGVNKTLAGAPQDSTPGKWDVAYYKQTYNYAKTGQAPTGVFVFPSDEKLATWQEVGKKFQGFIDNQNKWAGKFADAMGRMALFGNDKNKMSDCTDVL